MIDFLDRAAEDADELPLLDDLDRLWASRCAGCPGQLCGHEVLFSIAMGFKDEPRCLSCLARGLEQPRAELRDRLFQYVRGRDCYRRAWRVAGERERTEEQRPACLWPEGGSQAEAPRVAREETPSAAHAEASEVWDAGDMSCGDLVLALRIRLHALPAGTVLQVIARDPAAPEDLPAWCRLTGHALLHARHPQYTIQRKGT